MRTMSSHSAHEGVSLLCWIALRIVAMRRRLASATRASPQDDRG